MNSTDNICLSGQDPILLTDDGSCGLGFLCLNSSTEHPPAFCPPTQRCQAIRLQAMDNVCPEPQGYYEPIICPKGFYCPSGGQEQIQCPQGSFCPQGAYTPISCGVLSICPPESARELTLVGFFCIGLFYVVWFVSAVVPRERVSKFWGQIRAQILSKTVEKNDKVSSLSYISDRLPVENGVTDSSILSPQACNSIDSLIRSRNSEELGLQFDFYQLTYNLDSSRSILRNISGRIGRGRFFGIMGPSGAGKSTLINVLAGRIRQSCGLTAINQLPCNISGSEYRIGCVPQHEIIIPDLTVEENVLHSARIRLGRLWDDRKIKSHVHGLITCLGLGDVRDQPVGSIESRGISGGERKRASIALEVVAMPQAIILDEPTSGLDAKAAFSIMSLLQHLSSVGITVICTIHQPRIEIFRLLDDIMLLNNGEPVYLGEAVNARFHFSGLGVHFSEGCNPADVMIDMLVNQSLALESFVRIEDQPFFHSADDRIIKKRKQLNSKASAPSHSEKAHWIQQVIIYFICGAKQQRRQLFSVAMELATGAVAGLLIGISIYEHRGQLFQGYYRNPFQPLSSAVNYTLVPTVGLLSSLAISLAAVPAGIKTVAEEKLVFYQEIHSGHSPSAYFLGKDLATWPRILISSLHFTTFYMILATSRISFWTLFLLNTVYFFAMYGLASLIASLVRRQDALLLSMLASLISGILDGFGPRLDLVKSWRMQWLWYICPGTWYAEAFFTEHTVPFAYLYDIESAADFAGYVTGRTSFDIGIIILIGIAYRLFAYMGLMIPFIRVALINLLAKSQ